MPFTPPTNLPAQDAPPREWALWYASMGWPVLPCHTAEAHGCTCADGAQCKRPGKHPRIAHQWRAASTDATTIEGWWQQWPDANIQLQTGEYCVLDCDERSGGVATLQALEKAHGLLPATPLVFSGGGAGHRYFALPPGGCPTVDGIAPGLDLKGYHGLIVAPPSLHASGRRYVWDTLFSPDAFPLEPLPGWLLQLALDKLSQKAQGQGGAGGGHAPGEIIPEGERYQYLISLAGRLRYSGFTTDQILQALEVANQNCEPPEAEATLRIYAGWAGKQAPAPADVLHPPRLLTSPPLAGAGSGTAQQWGSPAPAPYAFDFSQGISGEALARMMIVPPRFLIAGLVPDGLTILAAPAKSYKSYFALSLALATLGITDWCGAFPAEETGNVVFFGLEAPPQQLRNRLHQLYPGGIAGATGHAITFFSGMRTLPTFKNGLQDALEQVIDHYDPRLIVIDPLSYLYRLGRQDDLASATTDLLWPLAEMAATRQVAIFAPEHMRKRSKDDVSVVDQLAGSHIKAAIVHGLIMVERQGDDIVLGTTMRDAASQEVVVTLAFDPVLNVVVWGYKGTNAAVAGQRQQTLKAQALQELRDKRYPLKTLDLLQNLGVPLTETNKANMRKILSLAEKEGVIVSNKRGEYCWVGP